ncbi:MAG: aminoglycoside phosphotransferase family protein [Myxococcota bacterium]
MLNSPPPHEVLRAYDLEDVVWESIGGGHINLTYRIGHGDACWALQRVNPIFSAEIHHNIEAVTEHLHRRGLLTPRLIRTKDRELWTKDVHGNVWRLMHWIDGRCHASVTGAALCQDAGRLLGLFHAALLDCTHQFVGMRLGVHDTAVHIKNLQQALSTPVAHPAYDDAQALGQEILQGLAELPPLDGLPKRLVHGDPKISNFIFDAQGEALCLVDLDTVGPMSIPLELGDALRSWCNPTGEDTRDAAFSMELFSAGLLGYRQGAGDLLSLTERQAIVPAVEMIALELAARFCLDILKESYFAWDRNLYEFAWQHHLLRTQSQLSLARSIAAQRAAMEKWVRRDF